MDPSKGIRHLLHDAVEAVTDLVQETHESVADTTVRRLSIIEPVGRVARVVEAVRRPAAAGVYETIRSTNRWVRAVTDAVVETASPPRPRAALPPSAGADGAAARPLPSTDAPADGEAYLGPTVGGLARATLNAAVGDFLARRGNDLAFPMAVCHRGRALPLDQPALEQAYPSATRRVCVFLHGLGATEREWWWNSEQAWGDRRASYPFLLERDRAFTPVLLRYNSGLHISENGRTLAGLLTDLLSAYPEEVDELVLVGHSMGGLVARSATHYGQELGASWLDRLTHVLCIGSPHHGAPLEKASNLLTAVLGRFDTPGTQIPAKVLRARSAGIKDLRFGSLVDEDWRDRDPDALLEDARRVVPLVGSVTYSFISGSLTRDPDHPFGQFVGDMMVRPSSAAGDHPDPPRRIRFHGGRALGGVSHVALMNHPAVYEQILRTLDGEASG